MSTSRNGRIVRERDRSKPQELIIVVLLCVVLSVPVFVYVWEQVTHYQLGHEIQQMERRKAELIEEGRKLDLERAQLSALGRVERIARDSLGFVDGAPVEVVAIRGGSPLHHPHEMQASIAEMSEMSEMSEMPEMPTRFTQKR